ncbi:transposase (plasmid) [Lyngbya confervoides BDU141951]|uniref:Transposase n=2 Tax=Lyngbya TaxID=28073 RepID=A0ABD4SXS0_9CYAN|nr:transposase [Lyngbya confervoides]MCM1981232.1 transposase [Lyngbya confervoides BDU141951]
MDSRTLKHSRQGKATGVDFRINSFCQLKYKAEREGKIYLEIGRFFSSRKTCHACLNQGDSLPLDVRSWECSSCKTKHHRDVNAAINIRDEGLGLLALEPALLPMQAV